MYYAMLSFWKREKIIFSMNSGGSIGITMLCCCFMLSALVSILCLMGNDVHKFTVDENINNNLKYINEYYLVSVCKRLANKDAIDKIFLMDNSIYTINTVKKDDVSCDVQGVKNGERIILIGEAKEKNIINRIYVELDKQGDRYVPKYWNY